MTKEEINEEDLNDIRVIFSLARKAYASDKETIEGLLKLEDKLFKQLDNGSVQSAPNKRARNKKSD